MKKISLLLILTIQLLFVKAQTDITAKEIYNHIAYLADDNKKGRFPGTPQSKEVANYLRNEYKSYNLKLLADNGFQYFEVITSAKLGKDNKLIINNKKYKLKKDFLPLAISKSGKFKGNAIIVGYGIVKKQDSLQWDDYKNYDVKGKWVIVFRGYPQNSGLPDDFFKDVESERSKIFTAQQKGALGIIFITPKGRFKNDLVPFQMPRFYSEVQIPAISVSENVAQDIFKNVKLTLEKYQQYIDKKPMVWDELNVVIEANVDVSPVKVKTQNVVALLEGNDPKLKNRYIVIGAHYDHLGMGGYDSGSRMPDTIAVHNGADDNASGTAGVLEIAEYLSANRDKIGRSIIFINFGAEERGLIGSQYFVDHPLVPLDSIDLMINMDMIGQYNGKLSIIGVGTGKQLKDLLSKVDYDTNRLKIKLIDNYFGGSDHASFYNAGIPALFFYASKADGYHTPFDDIEKIRPLKEKFILDFIANFAIIVSNYPEKIQYQKQKAEDSGGHNYGNVKLGVVPSFGSDVKGFKIANVVEGQPADKAGLKPGDIIIQIEQFQINNIYDYMEALKNFKKGDKIKVKVNRDGKILDFDVQL